MCQHPTAPKKVQILLWFLNIYLYIYRYRYRYRSCSTVTPSNDFVIVRPEAQSSRIMSPSEKTAYEQKAMEDQPKEIALFYGNN